MEYVYLSGWTRGEGIGGVTQFELNQQSGELKRIASTDEEVAFGNVFINPQKNVLYAVNEIRDPDGGNIFTYKMSPEEGRLELIGKVSTLAPNPAYLGLTKSGKYAVVADHSMDDCEALVVLYRVNEDGTLGEITDKKVLDGSSILKKQNMPHPHCAVFSPDGKFVAVCDKGTDDVRIYTVDEEEGLLIEVARWKETPGYMPRYAAFHPALPYFYHNNEHNSIVDAYRYDADGNFTLIGEYDAVIEDPGFPVMQQGLCIHPSGRYLYSAVKGLECVAVFEINQEDGSLTLIQNQAEEGTDWIRTVRTNADGSFLIATFLESGNAVVYRIGADGKLERAGGLTECSRAAGIDTIVC